MLFNEHPGRTEISKIRPFGCIAYTRVHKRAGKLKDKAAYGMYCGWDERKSCHIVYVPRAGFTSANMLYSASVKFDLDLSKPVGRLMKNKVIPHPGVKPVADVQPNIRLDENHLDNVVRDTGAEAIREQLQSQTVPAGTDRQGTHISAEEMKQKVLSQNDDGRMPSIPMQKDSTQNAKRQRTNHTDAEQLTGVEPPAEDVTDVTTGVEPPTDDTTEVTIGVDETEVRTPVNKWRDRLRRITRSKTRKSDAGDENKTNSTQHKTRVMRYDAGPDTPEGMLQSHNQNETGHMESVIDIDAINAENNAAMSEHVANLVCLHQTCAKINFRENGKGHRLIFEKPKQEIHIRSYVVNEEYAKINAIVNKVYRNWKEAQSSPLADGFIESADREFLQLEQRGTFTKLFRSQAPEGTIFLPSNMCHKAKFDSEGNVTKLKSRFNLGGHRAKNGIHVMEDARSAPTPRMSTIRYIVAQAARLGQKLLTADIVGAYLLAQKPESTVPIYFTGPTGQKEFDYNANGELEEVIYKLESNMYGHPGAGYAWFQHVDKILKEMGFENNPVEPCAHRRGSTELALFVDDFTVTGNDEELAAFQKQIDDEFGDSGFKQAEMFSGMNMSRVGENAYHLCMASYTESAYEKFKANYTVRGKDIPLPTGYGISKADCPPPGTKIDEPYRELVGSLQYCQMTAWQACYAQSQISRVQASPGIEHWNRALDVLGFLYKYRKMGITYRSGDVERQIDLRKKKNGKGVREAVSATTTVFKDDQLYAYSDSSHADIDTEGLCDCEECVAKHGIAYEQNDSYKTSLSHVICYANAPIHWRSSVSQGRQHHSTESEILAAANCSKECQYLIQFFEGWGKDQTPVPLHSDNQAALKICTNRHGLTRKAGHIKKKRLIAKDLHLEGMIKLEKVYTLYNPSDIGTKAICKELFHGHMNQFMESHEPVVTPKKRDQIYMKKEQYETLMYRTNTTELISTKSGGEPIQKWKTIKRKVVEAGKAETNGTNSKVANIIARLRDMKRVKPS